MAAKAFDDALEKTKQRIQAMSWDELLEKGVEIGATFLLDLRVIFFILQCL